MPPVRSFSKDDITLTFEDIDYRVVFEIDGRRLAYAHPDTPDLLVILDFDEESLIPEFVLASRLEQQGVDLGAFGRRLRELGNL